MSARIVKRSVTVAGHRTSVSVEDAFWQELKRIAAARGTSLGALISGIDRDRAGNLSSAIRLYVLDDLRRAAGAVARPIAGPSTGS